MKRPAPEVVEVQVSDLRKFLHALIHDKKPILLKRYDKRCAVVLCFETDWYGSLERPILARRRLRAELEHVLRKIR